MSVITYTKDKFDALLALRLSVNSNLSDLVDVVAARANLVLGTAAVENKVAAGQVGVLNAQDASTTDARTPLIHASTHGVAGSDEVSIDAGQVISGILNILRIPDLDASKITSGILAAARIPNLDAAKIISGVLATARLGTGTPDGTKYLRGDGAWVVPSFGAGGSALKAMTADPSFVYTYATLSTTPYFGRIVNPGSWSATKLGIIQGGSQSGNIELAIFHDNGSDAPGTLVATTGSVATAATTGVKTFSLPGSSAIQSGDWLGIVCSTSINMYIAGGSVSRPLWRARQGSTSITPGSFASNPSVSSSVTTYVPMIWGE